MQWNLISSRFPASHLGLRHPWALQSMYVFPHSILLVHCLLSNPHCLQCLMVGTKYLDQIEKSWNLSELTEFPRPLPSGDFWASSSEKAGPPLRRKVPFLLPSCCEEFFISKRGTLSGKMFYSSTAHGSELGKELEDTRKRLGRSMPISYTSYAAYATQPPCLADFQFLKA